MATRRVKDGTYLNFTRRGDCLACTLGGPSHAHHLQHGEGRSLGLRVGDNWTVPLCPACHHDLHHSPVKEEEWWEAVGIDPIPIATQQWEKYLVQKKKRT